MNPHVLVVEDDKGFVTELSEYLKKISPSARVDNSSNQIDALDKISRNFYDFIILDLNIPISADDMRESPQHGIELLLRARKVASGTPVVVLTGSPAESFIPELLHTADQKDVWGSGKDLKLVDFVRKIDTSRITSTLENYLNTISRLQDVELEKGSIQLTAHEDRIFRIFCAKVGGVKVSLAVLGGGLSGVKVFKLNVSDARGSPLHYAICKIGTEEEVTDEQRRFDYHISRLVPSATPRLLCLLSAGAKNFAGAFYSLAKGFDQNAFNLVYEDNKVLDVFFRRLEVAMQPWHEGVGESRISVAAVRRRSIGDTSMQAVTSGGLFEWMPEYEKTLLQSYWRCCHGDLHGGNLLVNAAREVVIIDYGDVDDGPGPLDPITLELSLFFHPAGPLRGLEWPTLVQAGGWWSLDEYLVDCPCPNFIRKCREWSMRASGSKREISATAIGYLLRQLKYDQPRRDLIINLIEGIKRFSDEHT